MVFPCGGRMSGSMREEVLAPGRHRNPALKSWCRKPPCQEARSAGEPGGTSKCKCVQLLHEKYFQRNGTFAFSRSQNTLWCQLEDMFQLLIMPQGIEKVTIQLKDTLTKVYAMGAILILSKVPLEVLQNWVMIQLIVTPNILEKVQVQIKEVRQLKEPRHLKGNRE